MESERVLGSVASRAPPATGLIARTGRVLLLASIPLSLVWLPLGHVSGVGNITVSDAALLGLWIVTAVSLLVRGVAGVDARTALIVVLAMSIAALAGIGSELSLRWGNGFFEFMKFMKRFGLASIVPLAAALFGSRSMGTWTRALTLIAIAGLVAFTVFPDLQQYLPRPSEWDPEALDDRATGPLTNANNLAYAAVALAILHGALLPPRPGAVDRVVFVAALAGSAICVVPAGSRSAIIGAAGALLFISFSSGIRIRSKVSLIAAAALTVMAGLSYSAVFEQRLTLAYRQGLREVNVFSRLDAQWLAIRTSLSHPFGVGYDGFARATANERAYFTLTTSDSVYFDTLLGAGFSGLMCLLWLLLTAWRHVGSSRVTSGRAARALKAGLVAFLLFGTATVVPISVFLSPLFFSFIGAASYPDGHAD